MAVQRNSRKRLRLEPAEARGNAERFENRDLHRSSDRFCQLIFQLAIMSGFARVARCAAKEVTISCGELFQHI